MTEFASATSKSERLSAAISVLLGYLNFSEGRPDPSAQSAINTVFELRPPSSWSELRSHLLAAAEQKSATEPAFTDIRQANAVISLTLAELIVAYRRHHADLLQHLTPDDYLQPFFMIRCFEAVLAAGGPWNETDRIVSDAIARLNDFVGHRPVAVLENGRRSEVYSHERFRPIPLYLKGADVAVGAFAELLQATLQHLQSTPDDVCRSACFSFDKLDEIAIDCRAYDALHPVFKRTNYLFGEWDPHLIDVSGYYRRFVVRQPILDALQMWMGESDLSPDEAIHDAAAVLCGTILMASAISGWGPSAYDSSVSLSSMLPVVARQRDEYYARLMGRLEGRRAKRLEAILKRTRQPFGHVRQRLNLYLAGVAANQMQRRAVAELYARMGFAEAARREVSDIPAASRRFECELSICAESAMRLTEHGRPAEAAEKLTDAYDLLKRGIDCGAIVDPWNILAAQGHFPLFQTREDVVPDYRVEWLLKFMERLFTAGARTLAEAAAGGEPQTLDRVREWLETVAPWWDRFATTTIQDLPAVSGHERLAAAEAVASTLSEWRRAGAATGDIVFWRERVGRLQNAEAYADVVRALLRRGDLVAGSGLLIQWLSDAHTIGLGDGDHSFFELAPAWLAELTSGPRAPAADAQVPLARRFFNFLEANAGDLLSVPTLTDDDFNRPGTESSPEPAEPEEENLFEAAYEDVVYRDSTADGREGDTLDFGSITGGTEFELRLRILEPRLQFLDMLARMWRLAAARVGTSASVGNDPLADTAAIWSQQAHAISKGLRNLAQQIEHESLGRGTGNLEANLEYDNQLQAKNHLQHLVVTAAIRMESAARLLDARGRARRSESSTADPTLGTLQAIIRGDAVAAHRYAPQQLAALLGQPLLYVAVENGGNPNLAIDARGRQDQLRLLADELPRLGLLRLTRRVLLTALRMERRGRPPGLAVTEFDRLFRSAFRTVLRVLAISIPPRRLSHSGGVRRQRRWDNPQEPARERRPLSLASRARRFVPGSRGGAVDGRTLRLIEIAVESFQGLWLRHSETMRLSAVEAFNDAATWTRAKRFIKQYGNELFHARMLPLSNLRAVLHGGIESFFDELIQTDDPLHPSPLVAAIEADPDFRTEAERLTSLIYAAVADEIERFVEYNSTTIQSDYGDKFGSFLEFLRLEAAYRRDEWNLTPFRLAHEVLAACGRPGLARQWETAVRRRTAAAAERHMKRLESLERRHAMRLLLIADHLAERFVKPFAVDRMIAQVPAAIEEARQLRFDGPAFRALRKEVDYYLTTTIGSPAELPDWLQRLDQSVIRALGGSGHQPADDREPLTGRRFPALSRQQILRQFVPRARRATKPDQDRE